MIFAWCFVDVNIVLLRYEFKQKANITILLVVNFISFFYPYHFFAFVSFTHFKLMPITFIFLVMMLMNFILLFNK
jgi:hypothetical protein